MQAFDLLALRHRVSDSTLLDWAELEQLPLAARRQLCASHALLMQVASELA